METQDRGLAAAGLCSPETHFLWEPPEREVSVYVSFDVIDGIAAQGSRAGGLLLGRVIFEGTYEVIVERFEPIEGEFWRGFPRAPEGPARREFERSLARWRPGRDQPLVALGYYRADPDEPQALASDDLFFISRYFSAPHHVFLLIERGEGGESTGAFFFWRNAQIQPERSVNAFPLDSRAIKGELEEPEIQPVTDLVPYEAEAARMWSTAEAAPPPETPPAVSRRPNWLWYALVAACCVLVVAALAYVRLGGGGAPQGVAAERYAAGLLQVDHSGPDFRVTWDRGAPAVHAAARGLLTIAEGDYRQELELDPEQLRGGSLLYTPLSSDVTFRLRLFAAADGRETASASVRVLAGSRPPMQPPDQNKPAAGPQVAQRAAPEVRVEPPVRKPPAVFQPPPERSRGDAKLLEAPSGDVLLRSGLPAATAPLVSARASAPPPPAAMIPAAPVSATYTPPLPVRRVPPANSTILRQTLRSLPSATVEIEVRLEIDAAGKVTSARVVSPAPGTHGRTLGALAEDAARQWKFEPARRNGQPTPSATIIPFRFVRSER